MSNFSSELRQRLRFYLDDIETGIGRLINLSIAGLVLLSLAIFIVDTYPVRSVVEQQLSYLNHSILIIFVIEYGLRLWSAERRWRYIFSLYGFIDLLAILPFLFSAINLDIRFLRIFRWFRILRLIRYLEGNTIFGYVTREDSAIFVRILFTLFTIIFIFSGLIYQVEHPVNPNGFATFLDAVYFSVATMTTVGYGDITPISELGRLLTVLMILSGIALIPWQIGELIKQLLKTSKQMEQEVLCVNCGLNSHDGDARYCKICGKPLAKVGDVCELPDPLPVLEEYPIDSSRDHSANHSIDRATNPYCGEG